MQITVLGKSPSWQDADGACSGYLVEEDGACLLLDCGNGVFSKLRRFRDYVDIDAVVISHLHADHFLDLVPFAYALTYAPRQQPVPVDRWPGTDSPARPRLLRAARARAETFRRIVGAWGSEDLIEKAFDLRRVRPRRDARRRRRCGSASTRCRTSRRRTRSRSPRRTAAGASPTAPTARPNDELVALRRRRGPAHHRGDAAAPGARGPARAPHAGRGRRRTARGRASGASSSPTSPTSSTSCGRAPRPRRRSAARSSSRTRAPSTRSDGLAGGPLSEASPRDTVRLMPPERDLFANFERMRREMDELFGDVFDRTGLAPPGAAASPRGRRLLRRATRRARSSRPSWPASTRTS